ncbi:MAG: hypothetical protein FJX73_09825 [Armatimonadetes bacterium]|nr:hypothetical protein [Armatimonadota bacterium]
MYGLIAACLLLLALVGGAAPPRAERTAGDLRVELTIGSAAYAPGATVQVTLRVTNLAALPAVLTASSAQEYDFFARQRSALIWQWSHDRAFAQVVREMTLAPGQTRTYTASWDQRDLQGRRVEAGAYEVSAVFLGAQRQGPASVEVGPVRITIGP